MPFCMWYTACMVDRVRMRHMLGPSMQFIDGKLDTVGGSVGDVSAELAALDARTDALEASTAALGTRVYSQVFDVRNFTNGAPLSNTNIDAAIAAARDAAIAAVAGTGLSGRGAVVSCPAGEWQIAGNHVFPSAGVYEMPVSFRGAGKTETIFHVSTDVGHTPVFTFGSFNVDPNPLPHTAYLEVGGFSIVGENGNGPCNRIGIRMYGPIVPLVSDYRARGLRDPGCRWDECHALQILESQSGVALVNSQFPMIRDSDIFGCNVGIYLLQCGPTAIENVHCQGNQFREAIFENSDVTWSYGGIQGGSRSVSADVWNGNLDAPSITTGWSSTTASGGGALPSGTGATCETQTDRLCTVRDLSGLDTSGRAQRAGGHEYMFLELITAGSSANERKVGGIYKIEQVLSATSCTIRKGSNHTSQSGLTWQVRQSRGYNRITIDHLYNESTGADSLLGVYAGQVARSSAEVINCTFSTNAASRAYVEAHNADKVSVRNVTQSANLPKYDAYVRNCGQTFVDNVESRVYADDASAPGVMCLSSWQSSPQLNNPGIRTQGWKDRLGGRSVRLARAMAEMDFAEYWDARIVSSVNANAGNAESITGRLGGTVLGPRNPGIFPLYEPLDAGFEGPCIVNVPGTGTTGGSIQGTIPHARFPADRRFSLSIVIVARLESATPGPADPLRVWLSQAGYGFMGLAFNDGVFTSGGQGSYALTPFYQGPDSYTGNALLFSAQADTDPHVWVLSTHATGSAAVSTDYDAIYEQGASYAFESFVPGVDINIQIGGHGR
jgi:hypothetical protein